jgi:Helix-turn-helix domain
LLLRSDKRELIREKIGELALDPSGLTANVKKLKGRAEHRLRVQDWRVIFRFADEVLWIDHRPSRLGLLKGKTMVVQFVEIAGQRMAVLPVADYERLLDLAEDRADALAAAAAEKRRLDGEEYLPAAMVDRMLAGESPLRVWRTHRDMTLAALGTVAGVSVGFLSDIELGKRRGKPGLWRKLAEALNVSADDILPVS